MASKKTLRLRKKDNGVWELTLPEAELIALVSLFKGSAGAMKQIKQGELDSEFIESVNRIYDLIDEVFK
uniref:Uncharacterized protein n=1 Tax=Candidatus Kentrum sp. LPFa TaxID=2126335 RepID=A0A450WDE9_9GAMM|nr:MAG: hypothetical protein BECKLPF1236B_GA0070989_10717 [Candidatus Kentron sp. LPFa]